MSPIEKNCPTWPYHYCFGESSPSITQHIFHERAIQEWEGEGTAPNSSVKVTHISKQCFILGWLDSGLWAGDQDGKQEGGLSDASSSHRSFVLWGGMSMWPSLWRLAPDVSSTRLLDLTAMDRKLVAVNWNSGYSHLMWVQRPWQEIKQTTWFELTVSLSCCLGLHLCATNGNLPPGTTMLGNLRMVMTLPQLSLLNQIWDSPQCQEGAAV